VHRVLQPLHELLEMRDASLKRTELIPLGADSRWCCSFVGSLGRAANLADPRDQSLTLGHSSPPTGPLRGNRAGRVAAALLLGHLPDHQRAALNLLADPLEFLSPLLFCPLAAGLHSVTSPPPPHGRNGPVRDAGLVLAFGAVALSREAPGAS
jgi:hypothetical protein